MTTAQKEYLKKLLKGLAIAAYCFTTIVLTAIGVPNGTWPMWVALGMMLVPAAAIAFVSFYVPIATLVWHWRLMGECKNDWEARTFNRWWFWIQRSDSWVKYLTEEIEEYYEEEENRQMRLDFLHRLESVKKPSWL